MNALWRAEAKVKPLSAGGKIGVQCGIGRLQGLQRNLDLVPTLLPRESRPMPRHRRPGNHADEGRQLLLQFDLGDDGLGAPIAVARHTDLLWQGVVLGLQGLDAACYFVAGVAGGGQFRVQ